MSTTRRLTLLTCFFGLWLVVGGGSCKGLGLGGGKSGGGGGAIPVAFSASQSSLSVSAVSGGGGLASPTLTITNPNSSSASYTASGDQPWLVVTPGSGALAGGDSVVINVYVNASSLTNGSYTGKVIVTNPGSPGTGATQIYITVIISSGGSAPAVTSPPANATVNVGQSATFAVTASGTVTLTYQWQKNGSNLPGATNSFYTTPPTTAGDAGSTYRVIVTNGYGSVISSAATLTVNSANVAPTVLTQPQSQSVPAGNTATFNVSATGTAPLAYQWQKNGVNIAGATTPNYTTPVLTLADNGATYKVTVSNPYGSTTSQTATLTVTAAGVAPTITAQPVTQTVVVGQTATFTVTAAGTAPLSYQWYFMGHSSDVAIAGATSASYTTPATTVSDDSTAFRCKVTNGYGTVASDYATLFVQAGVSGPTISGQPASVTVSVGQPASFSVTAAGTAPLYYQWQKNGVDIGGAQNATYTTPATSAGDNGAQYRVIVSNDYGTVTSSLATLTVNTAAPAFNLTPNSLNFTAVAGGSDPATQLVNLSNSGTGGTQLNWTATSNQSWLSVSPGAGITPTGPAGLTIGASLAAPAAWTDLPPGGTTPSKRETFSTVWTGSRMIIWGGWNGSGVLNDGYSFNPATSTWTAISATNAPSARNTHCAVWTGTEMVVWGGYDGGGNYVNTGGRYNPATDTWSATPMSTTNAPTARRYASAVWTGAEMIVWGGADVWNGVSTGGRYNPATNSWSPTPTATAGAPSGRTAHSAIWTGTEMIVWGGTSSLAETDALQDGGRYNPATNSWSATPISTSGAPVARFGHTAVWTGGRMIVWGGSSNLSTRRNDGAEYDPATNTWTGATANTGAPQVRHHHGAVWTGSEMIVWGGWYGPVSGTHIWLNDGGRYKPAGSLSAGVYSGQITLNDPAATNNPQAINVTFTVAAASGTPAIGLSPTTLTFNTLTGSNPSAQTVNLTNTGTAGSLLNWTVMPDKPWLQVSPSSGGTTTGTSVLTVNAMTTQSESWLGPISTTNAPGGRVNFWAVWTGSKMLIWGGYRDGGFLLNDGQAYDPVTDSWSAPFTTTGAPTQRRNACVCWTGKELFVYGGKDTSGLVVANGALYNPATDSWRAMSTVGGPGPLEIVPAVWTGTQVLLWGGHDSSLNTVTNRGHYYNPATDTWTANALSTAGAPAARYGHVGVWTGSKLVVWGGRDFAAFLPDGGIYDPGSNTWTAMAASPLAGREGHTAIWDGDRMLIWGGGNAGGNVNDGALFDPATNTWTGAITTTGAPPGAGDARAVWTGKQMIIWGGRDNGGNLTTSGYRYRPGINLPAGVYTGNVTVRDPAASNNPQSVAVTFNVTAPVPPSIALSPSTLTYNTTTGVNPTSQAVNLTNPTASSSLNWTVAGDKPWLQVAPASGTTTTGTSVLTVNAVAAQAESWSATSTVGAPSNRETAAAVWTGKEMIVFGGGGTVSPLNDGAIYNPATNTWRAMSSTGAPAVFKHIAVWTGTKMIVWGGSTTLTNMIDTGAIYDPATDTWSGPLSLTNAPSARRHPCAVWTGTEMVVWGGDTAGGVVNDGGRYNPATDTWNATAMSTVNAPSARFGQTAVWTGTEMVVWGGYDGSFLNTGGRYNPATNTWSATPVSTVGAPTARAHHSAVWNGERMIVWGGTVTGSTEVNDGALYDPATNAWTGVTTTTGAPSNRHAQVSVWTGVEMVVWGGWSGSFFNTGGRYRPAINLLAGAYTANLTVRDPLATNNPQSVAVTFNVAAPTPPSIGLSPATLTYNTTTGVNPASQAVNLTNPTASSTLNWTAGGDKPWLQVTPISGMTTTGTSVLTVNAVASQSEAWTGGTSSTGVPSPRENLSLVWTGSEMIVWGGFNGGNLGAGGRYNPVTDTWTAMATLNQPSVRRHHTAVWTGSRMLVWGGLDDTANCNTGGSYDPATDTWSGITSTNAPGARREHSAIWTGSEMIIWGGVNGAPLVDGGRYNPATDTWSLTATATSGAPSARYEHSAIWTGTEMLIWGGLTTPSTTTNTGGRYNPATNTWTGVTTTTNAPTNREGHCAIFDGQRMIVWGGETSGTTNNINSGGIYDVAGDTWLGATTLVGAPGPRRSARAIWTGKEMIMWGGNTGGYENTGARYRPPINLAAGVYTANLTVRDPLATNNPQSVAVTFNVTTPPVPSIALSPSTLTFSTTTGTNPATQTSALTNPTAGSTLNWSAQSDAIWLNATPTNGAVTTGTTTLTFSPKVTQTDSWPGTATTTSAPSVREAMSVVWTGKEMIVWGGWDDAVVPNGGIYNPATDSWRSINTSGAPQVAKHVAVWTGSKMIVWGGMDSGSGYLSTGAAYDPATDTWSAISSTNAPSGRWHPAVCWTGTEMIVWGGQTSGGYVNTGGRYNPATDTWNATPISTTNAPSARVGASGIWSGTEMIVWGGTTDGGVTGLQDGGRYNPGTDSWVAGGGITATGAPTARYHHTAVWDGLRMIVWGGSSDLGTRLNTGAVYDPASDTWLGATTGTGAPAIRHGHGAIWTGNEMIVWGGWWGSTGPGHLRFNDGPRYRPAFNLAAGSYTGHLTVSDPAASNNPQQVTVTLNVAAVPPPTIVLNPTTLTFSGGTGGPDPAAQTSQLTNSGAGSTLNWTTQSDAGWLTVSPTTGTTTSGTTILTVQPKIGGVEGWTTATSTTGAPGVREGASAVWTGTQMVLFGGDNGSGGLNTGGRYTPGTDSWVATSTVGAPSARWLHTAVWTGSRMLVFGGDDGIGALATTGGIYNPTTNAWSNMSMVNAPAARRGHCAVWTGSEMIVWGGFIDLGTTGTNGGARYNPATDTWNPTPISTTNAPSARAYHSAVWTGTEMIVWGGYNSTNLLNDGHRYNPATDTWIPTPIATTGAPTARELHSAAWNGRQMLIWGGDQNAAQTAQWDTGGLYDPAADTWLTMTTTGAPAARHRAAAAWTGTEMIVWGGWRGDTNSFLNDGKRYVPPGLPAGSYTGHITVSDPAASNNPQQITVNLTVAQPSLGVSSNALVYDVTADDIPTFSIQNTTAGTLSYTVTSDQTWLIAPPAGTVTAGTPVTVLPDVFFMGLSAGSHTANLTITAPGALNSPQTVSLTVQVGPVDNFEAGASYLRDVYVAETGDDTTGDGTFGNPYRSADKALTAALPGDHIHMLKGTFPGHISAYGQYVLGTYANPIKLSGDPSGGTVMDCTTANGGNGMYASGLTFLIIENIEMVNFDSHGISFDGNINGRGRGHHLIIRNVKVHNPLTNAVDCIKLNNTDCSVVENCDASLNGTSAGGSNTMSTRFCYHTVFRRNYMHESTLYGLRFGSNSRDNLAYANRIVNMPDRGINLTGMRNLAVANVLINCKNSLAFENAEEALAVNNTVYNASQFVLWFSKNVAEPTEARNGRIVNNIFVFRNANLTNYCNNGASTFPATYLYQNNLWYSLDTPGFAGPTNTAAAEINPLYQVDPLFVNATIQDFHLQAGSGARGNGLAVTEAPKDFDGTAYASPRARGAFEGLAGPTAVLNLAPATINLTATAGDANSNTQNATVTNTGAGGSLLTFTAGGTQPWLRLTPSGGNTAAGAVTMQVSAAVTLAESWGSATATAGAPGGREDFSAVWTGQEMIVWGGSNGGVLQTGGRYNPATNAWTALPTAGAPAARRLHTAVWTGTRMIVWGGLNAADAAINDGAMFDPVLNAWVGTTTLTGAAAARRSHTAVWTGTEMIVWGGYTQGTATILNDGKRYNPATDTWTTTTSLTNVPSARYTHCAVWTGTDMIVWGGYDGGGYISTGGRYNAATNTWNATAMATGGAPVARGVNAAVWTGDRMLIWAGSSTGSNVLNDGAAYDPAANTWSAPLATAGQPSARRGLRGVWTGREMLVWGGYNGSSFLNTGGRYFPALSLAAGVYNDTVTVTAPGATASPQTIAVTLTVAAPPVPAIGLSSTSLAFSCAVGGNPSAQGVTITNPGDAGSTLNWRQGVTQPWDKVSPYYGSVTTGSNLLIVQPLATQLETWQSPINLTGAPTARAGAATVWTGSKMFVWGGETGYGIYAWDGKLYDPATDSWSAPLSTTNMPTAAVGHPICCWTGTEVIIWGGQVDAGSAPLNEGRLYNPSTDTWRTMSIVNSPGPLTGHTEVWTGTEMIVWGGSSTGPGVTRVNTGRKYNPVTNTWATLGISTDNAPSARFGHTASWCGKYMVVWGGDDGSSYLNTGGLYDPVTDTWVGATDTTTAPSPRYAIISVWTGKEMIVYGGHPGAYGSSGPDGYTNTGARYDPLTNTWVATSTTGATGKTRSAEAVWTGHEMIVFGGYDGFNFQQYGNKYVPPVALGSGVYNDTITVSDPQASNNPQTVDVQLTVTGSAAAPAITSNPASKTVYLGERPVFFVGASGAPTLSYQWQKNSVNIPGATAQFYRAPATVLGDDGANFRCVVTNGAGSATSNAATITLNLVGLGPVVTTHPSDTTVTAGQTATFIVAVTGSPTLQYQWQKNNVDIPGATQAAYTTPATVLGDSGSTYRVIITNGFGNATSLPGTLTVNP